MRLTRYWKEKYQAHGKREGIEEQAASKTSIISHHHISPFFYSFGKRTWYCPMLSMSENDLMLMPCFSPSFTAYLNSLFSLSLLSISYGSGEIGLRVI
jgi:hypothetical protein